MKSRCAVVATGNEKECQTSGFLAVGKVMKLMVAVEECETWMRDFYLELCKKPVHRIVCGGGTAAEALLCRRRMPGIQYQEQEFIFGGQE